MAVHAAMIEAMDAEIGRIFDQLKQDRVLWENTLVMFLSDNGASAEIMVRGDGHDSKAAAGAEETYLCLGPGWSSVSNTPFRRHKTWVHEGGISTPMIVHWPAKIKPERSPVSSPCHVIDIAPTLYQIATLEHPESDSRWTGPESSGTSFLAELVTESKDSNRLSARVLWWQHEGNRALREGNLKLVAAGKESAWELYDLATDRSESRNLAEERPQEVQRLATKWSEMTERHRIQASDENSDVRNK
jgi:arylsulfatase